MEVRVHREVWEEFARLPEADARAVRHALAKLELLGIGLGFPHSSAVRGADRLRELRPKGGRCRWRALYRQIGQVMWVGAIGPEAAVDRLGFARAIKQAEERLKGLE